MGELLFSCKIVLPSFAVKKNNKQILVNRATGKRFIASSTKAQHLENALVTALIKERLKKRLDTITCEVVVKFEFFYPMTVYYTKQGKLSNRVADLSNLYQAPEDALQKAKILENDKLISGHDGSRRIPWNDNNYSMTVFIYKLA